MFLARVISGLIFIGISAHQYVYVLLAPSLMGKQSNVDSYFYDARLVLVGIQVRKQQKLTRSSNGTFFLPLNGGKKALVCHLLVEYGLA